MTVFYAGGDPGSRGVLRTLLEAIPSFAVVGDAASGRDAIAVASALRPDLVLMDARMPDMDGIDTARALLSRDPDLVVVLMSEEEMPPPSGIGTPGPRVLFVRKGHVSPQLLLDLWHGRRTRCGPNWIVVRLGED